MAFSAADAFGIVHTRYVVFHRNGTVFAGFYAAHAAETARFALLACTGAFIPVFAKHRRLGGV